MGARKSRVAEPSPGGKKSGKGETVDFSKFPARVDRVNVTGLLRTHDDYVIRTADDLFKANTFQDVILECNNARQYINELGIFIDVRIHIDVSRGKDATPNGYEITFDGAEYSRIVGALGTEIGHNEGSLTAELASPNIFGRGERLSLQFSYSNCRTTDLSLRLFKPFYHTILKNYRPEISFDIFRHTATFPVSAFKSHDIGALGGVSFLTLSPFELSHTLQYEMSFREIFTAGKHVPFFVREHCGPKMASLIRAITVYDQRDSGVFPTKGLHVKTTSEFNGLGGNISYVMNNTHAELSVPLVAGCVAQLCTKFGLIHIDKKSEGVPISSLFTLGGPLTIRGFKMGGVGPHSEGFACGISSYWAAGLHLWTPMPFNSYLGILGNNFRTHFFYNFGNCQSFSLENMRSAAGLGLAYRFGDKARIELNYCVPLERQKGDRANKGFQFGIGYEFL